MNKKLDTLKLEDNPAYAAALARLEKLQARRAGIAEQLDAARAACCTAEQATCNIDARYLTGEDGLDRDQAKAAYAHASARVGALEADLATIDRLIADADARARQETVLAERTLVQAAGDELRQVRAAVADARSALDQAVATEAAYIDALLRTISGPYTPYGVHGRLREYLELAK